MVRMDVNCLRSHASARLLGFLGPAIVGVAWLFLLLAPAHAEDRVALVIGNSAYRDLLTLENPYNDASDMAAALWEAGFETIELIDATREDMLAGIATFAKRLEDGTDAVFFYAGHGVQSHGANFLLPVDTRVEHAGHLAEFGIDANEIAVLMAASNARINVLILDACRDNPFAGTGSRLAEDLRQIDQSLIAAGPATEVVVRSTGGGLAPMHASRAETIVGYSTGPGEVALDGERGNSPYTAALLEHINTPGLEIDSMFRRVRATVRESTSGIQIPWVASTLENEFYIRPVVEMAAMELEEAVAARVEDTRKLGMAPPGRLVEDAVWQIAGASEDGAELASYLERYPEGRFAAEAQARLAGDVTAPASGSAARDGEALRAFVGVGPVPFEIEIPADVARGVVAFEVNALPGSGTFYRPDGTPVRNAHLLTADHVRELRFLPLIGTKLVGLTEHLELRPIGADQDAAPLRIAVSSEIHACDLLAGFRHAPDRVWDGIQQAILERDPLPAVEACDWAVRTFPEVDRFIALISRAYRAAGDYDAARRWAEQAIARNYPHGFSQLGTMYLRGDGMEVNYERALELFEQGFALGNPASALRIGEMYESGLHLPQDHAEAYRWYSNSIALGNAYAQTRLAALYEHGLGVERDLARAAELYRGAAAVGDLTAQIRMVHMYRDGIGVERDAEQALAWARSVAGAGIPAGQKALGQLYASEPERNLIAATYWLERADANGDPWAPKYLGELYSDVSALGIDMARAEDYFMRAVDRGNVGAARNLANLPSMSTSEVAHWNRIAAEAGNIWAMRDYGRALMAGEGAEPDPSAGFGWLVRAADGGNPWAQRDVGRALLSGEAVAADPARSARYLAMAAVSGDEGVTESARRAFEEITRQDRIMATQLLLAELGFDAGPSDGIAGPATQSALGVAAASLEITTAAAESIETIGLLATAARKRLEVAERHYRETDDTNGVD